MKTTLIFTILLTAFQIAQCQDFKLDKKSKKFIYKDKESKSGHAPAFDTVQYFSYGLWAVRENGRWGAFHRDDGIVVPLQYDKVIEMNNVMSKVISDGKLGLYEHSKGLLLDAVFDDIDHYKNGQGAVKFDGEWGMFKDGSFEASDEVVFKNVDKKPVLFSCAEKEKDCTEKEIMVTFYKHIRYPEEAQKKGIEGMVVIALAISKEGQLMDAYPVREIGAGCEEEAVRVVKEHFSHWVPGVKDGKNVNCQHLIPVKFKLN